jgi:hypothetical protein
VNKPPKDFFGIYTKHPTLFPKNCIQCRTGWYEIIDQMCSAIRVYVDNEIYDKEIHPQFKHIRERFGILDIQIEGGDEVVNLVAKSCERLSCKTCEYCGTPGDLYCSSKHRDWSRCKTLCIDHAIDLFYYQLYKSRS